TLFVYNNEKTTYGFIGESWYELTESGWKSVIDNENLKQQFVNSMFKDYENLKLTLQETETKVKILEEQLQ
ncbi:2757_t:CDS:2, partial [Racocetra fulgida]